MTIKLILLLFLCSHAFGMNLTKVLIVSRHNLRTPLTKTLDRMTPKIWPTWDKKPGELTYKGAMLEHFMGDYFSQWLHKQGLIKNSSDVHIYANTKQRTKDTAQAFATAFYDYNIQVNFKNITEMDPIFNPVFHNTTEDFKIKITKEMEAKLNALDLKDAYNELNRITDIKNSLICKEENYCDLGVEKNEIVFEIGQEPNVAGPFFIGNSMVDTFLMSYYEGKPLEEVGWGEIKTEQQWKTLSKFIYENQSVRFLTSAAKDLALPLLKYMKEKLDSEIKFTLLVGHDSNLSPILKSLDFKSYQLPEQLEKTPIGSKLVFQKWTNGTKDFLKVEMVYQSMNQLRNGEKLSLDNPPKNVLMEMKKCPIDKYGFCPWNKFMSLLNDLVE